MIPVICPPFQNRKWLPNHGFSDAARAWPHDPTAMEVESPVVLVRETADEQNFVTLATLTAAK